MAKRKRPQYKPIGNTKKAHRSEILNVFHDDETGGGIVEMSAEPRPGYPSFMTLLSPPQLVPFVMEAYPEHLFWRYITSDQHLGISQEDLNELRREGWESVGPDRDAARLLFTGDPSVIEDPSDEREKAILCAQDRKSVV